MELSSLEKIGLTKNQAKLYVSLLKLGQATAQQIMHESGMHRSRVYDSLESLEEQGLVSSVVKDFKRYFQAVSPEKLLQYIEEKKQAVKNILPELKRMEGMKKEEINGAVYKGQEGLKSIHNEMLKLDNGEKVYVLGAKGLIFSEFPYFMPNFEKQRLVKNIKFYCLFDDKEAMNRASEQRLMEGRILPKGYESNGVVNIFGNKVAIVLWKEKHPSGFLIDNKDIADSYRKWFDLIWKLAKK